MPDESVPATSPESMTKAALVEEVKVLRALLDGAGTTVSVAPAAPTLTFEQVIGLALQPLLHAEPAFRQAGVGERADGTIAETNFGANIGLFERLYATYNTVKMIRDAYAACGDDPNAMREWLNEANIKRAEVDRIATQARADKRVALERARAKKKSEAEEALTRAAIEAAAAGRLKETNSAAPVPV